MSAAAGGTGRPQGCATIQRFVLGALLLIGTSACSQSTLDTFPVDITVSASPTTAARGDTVSFTVNAHGGNLLGIAIDYGDSSSDQYGTSGARSARVTFKHAYQAPGTFTVQATVTDAVGGQKDASIAIRVN
jgi:PKD domain-containing protein